MNTDSAPEIRTKSHASLREINNREGFYETFAQCPIPPKELLFNLGLFLSRQALSRILFMNELYQRIIPVHGIVAEFGVRWGQNLALFSSFRGIYEPYNFTRKIVGFDTFSGFPSVSRDDDGGDDVVRPGSYGVTGEYERYLDSVLAYHEAESPLGHIKKFELIKGDATVTFGQYLAAHPETIIALAYFDFDLYEPTKKCLELIRCHLTKGSVVGFDDLNSSTFPGETKAMKDVLGFDRFSIRRSQLDVRPSYVVID
jgi:hypothetical protein